MILINNAIIRQLNHETNILWIKQYQEHHSIILIMGEKIEQEKFFRR